MSIKDVFPNITDEQWNGNAPYGIGGDYMGKDGGIDHSELYSCYFGGGEAVNGVIGKGEINLDGGVQFWISGLYYPHFRVFINSIDNPNKLEVFDSEGDSPKIFDRKYKRYLKEPAFKTEFGKMFVEQIKKALNYELR